MDTKATQKPADETAGTGTKKPRALTMKIPPQIASALKKGFTNLFPQGQVSGGPLGARVVKCGDIVTEDEVGKEAFEKLLKDPLFELVEKAK